VPAVAQILPFSDLEETARRQRDQHSKHCESTGPQKRDLPSAAAEAFSLPPPSARGAVLFESSSTAQHAPADQPVRNREQHTS